MKRLIILLACIGCIVNNAISQSQYYDVLALSMLKHEVINERIVFQKKDSLTLAELLAKYVTNAKTYNDVISAFQNNPFIRIPINTSQSVSSASFEVSNYNLLQKSATQIGGLNVTSIADGLSQFLIERANEEINILFFDRFRTTLKENEELKTVFPTTSQILIYAEPYQYAQMIQILKESFQKDIKDLVLNIENLMKLEKYQEIIKKNNLNFVYAAIEASKIVSELAQGNHPADAISNLGYTYNLDKVNSNLPGTLRLLSLLSNSIRDTLPENGWLKPDVFQKNILNDPICFQIFVGLLYQKSDNIFFIKDNDTIGLKDLLRDHKDNLLIPLQNQYILLYNNISKMNSCLTEIKELRKKGEKVGYEKYYSFFDATINTLENSKDFITLIDKKIDDKGRVDFQKYLCIARLSNEMYKNTSEKNYSLALMNFVLVMDQILTKEVQIRLSQIIEEKRDSINSTPEKRKAFIEKLNEPRTIFKKRRITNYFELQKPFFFKKDLLKYGAFMAAVAKAETADDVKNAIKVAALPAGSASIKKHTLVNISLNSYLGGFIGHENVYNIENVRGSKIWVNSYGLYAPVGLAFSSNCGSNTFGSLSLYLQVVDIGAITSFRLQNGNDAELPKIELKNIMAFGGYIVYGLPKAPISFGLGFQKGPVLRKININDQPESVISKANRSLCFFIAFDIPIFNIYTSSK